MCSVPHSVPIAGSQSANRSRGNGIANADIPRRYVRTVEVLIVGVLDPSVSAVCLGFVFKVLIAQLVLTNFGTPLFPGRFAQASRASMEERIQTSHRQSKQDHVSRFRACSQGSAGTARSVGAEMSAATLSSLHIRRKDQASATPERSPNVLKYL
jgi:hypothetical protein